MIAIRIPAEYKDVLDKYAADHGVSRSDVVNELIERFVEDYYDGNPFDDDLDQALAGEELLADDEDFDAIGRDPDGGAVLECKAPGCMNQPAVDGYCVPCFRRRLSV